MYIILRLGINLTIQINRTYITRFTNWQLANANTIDLLAGKENKRLL